MFYRIAAILLLLLPYRSVAQLAEPAWLNPERQAELMQQAIDLYTCIANVNVWNTLPTDLRLSPGDTNVVVPKLQYNLLLTKDLALEHLDSTSVYDSLLVAATINFQKRHGIKATGMIGPQTVAAINVVLGNDFMDVVMDGFKSLKPFNDFLTAPLKEIGEA